MDDNQVIDLLSWAHTCLCDQEGSLLYCRGFGLFLDRLIGGRETWRSKHHTETRSQVWGLGVQVWTETWTPWQESGGLVLLVPRVQAGRVFQGTQLWYIGSWITGQSSTICLQSSSVVRTRRWKMEKGNLIAYHLLESSTGGYIEWLVNEPMHC